MLRQTYSCEKPVFRINAYVFDIYSLCKFVTFNSNSLPVGYTILRVFYPQYVSRVQTSSPVTFHNVYVGLIWPYWGGPVQQFIKIENLQLWHLCSVATVYGLSVYESVLSSLLIFIKAIKRKLSSFVQPFGAAIVLLVKAGRFGHFSVIWPKQ